MPELYKTERFDCDDIDHICEHFENLAKKNCKQYDSRRKHRIKQAYYRRLILKAYIKKFSVTPNSSSKHNPYARSFGYTADQLYEGLIGASTIKRTAAKKAAELLEEKFLLPNLDELDKEELEEVCKGFIDQAKENYSKYGDKEDRDIQQYYRSLVIKAYVKRFSCTPLRSKKHDKYAQFFGYSSARDLSRVLLGGRRIDKEVAVFAAQYLGIKFEQPGLNFCSKQMVSIYDIAADELSERYIEDLCQDFCSIPREGYQSDLDLVQDQWRSLIIKAYIKKFSALPSNSKTHDKHAKYFGYSSAGYLYKCLTRWGRVREEAVSIAAKILGVSYKKPEPKRKPKKTMRAARQPNRSQLAKFLVRFDGASIENLKEEEIDEICKAFCKQARKYYAKNKITDLDSQDYYRSLIVQAYIKKFSAIPRVSGRDEYAAFFGYNSHRHFYVVLTRGRRIREKHAQIAADFLGEELHLYKSDDKLQVIPEEFLQQKTDEAIKYFKEKRSNSKSYEEITEDRDIQDYFKELIIRAYIKKFHRVPLSSKSHDEYAKFFRHSSAKSLYIRLAHNKRISKGVAQIAAESLGEALRMPKLNSCSRRMLKCYEISINNLSEQDIEDLCEDFCNEARDHYVENYISIDADAQDCYRRLIIKAYIKKFSKIPSTSQDHNEYAEFFECSSARYLYQGLIGVKRIGRRSACIAAEVLGEDFPEDMFPETEEERPLSQFSSQHPYVPSEEELEAACEAFCKRSREKNYSEADAEVQNCWRVLVAKAYIKKFSKMPSTSKIHNEYAKFFGYTSARYLYDSLAHGQRIKPEAAHTAAEVLGVEFPPRIEFSKESIDLILNDFQERANKSYQAYQAPKEVQKEQDHFRSLVIRAFLKRFSIIPQRSKKQDPYAKDFAGVVAPTFYRSLVFGQGQRIHRPLAQKAAEILQEELTC